MSFSPRSHSAEHLDLNRSGMPHIILSVWYDTYDYANRVERLNIGVFGNKTCGPGVRAEEFGQALVRVTGVEAAKFRTEAKRLKEVCRTKGNGREVAAMAILKETTSFRKSD